MNIHWSNLSRARRQGVNAARILAAIAPRERGIRIRRRNCPVRAKKLPVRASSEGRKRPPASAATQSCLLKRPHMRRINREPYAASEIFSLGHSSGSACFYAAARWPTPAARAEAPIRPNCNALQKSEAGNLRPPLTRRRASSERRRYPGSCRRKRRPARRSPPPRPTSGASRRRGRSCSPDRPGPVS